jgi:hypothetical protein
MGLKDTLGFGREDTKKRNNAELSEEKALHYPITDVEGYKLNEERYVEYSCKALYERIIFSVLSEIAGDSKQVREVLRTFSDWYSPEYTEGLASIMSDAIAKKKRVRVEKHKRRTVDGGDGYYFERSDKELQVTTVFDIDFRKFHQSKLVESSYIMMFNALNSASKGMLINQGMLLKIAGLTTQKSEDRVIKDLEEQLTKIDDSIKKGRVAYVDADSSAEFFNFDVKATSESVDFIYSQLANITGYPVSWINGVGGSSMSDTGESDRKQIRRANEYYFVHLLLPILEQVFGSPDNAVFSLKPEMENLTNLPSILSALEMSEGLLTFDAKKKTMMEAFGYKEEDFVTEEPQSVGLHSVR